jgi:hypothetical protein
MDTHPPRSRRRFPLPWRTVTIVGLAIAIVAVWKGGREDEAVGADRRVEYHLFGSAPGADITYTGINGVIRQVSGRAVPLTDKDGNPMPLLAFVAPGTPVTFVAANTGLSGSLTCQITVDGKTVAEDTASGDSTTVMCSATV